MWRHYVYIHRKESDNTPFYVGKGTRHRSESTRKLQRAYAIHPRNNHWKGTVKKYGLIVEIVMHCFSDEEARNQEVLLIKAIGRLDLGEGPLVNKTDGGDGHGGLFVSKELREKRSINSRGPRSPAWIASMRAARKNGGNGGVVKLGDTLPASWVANLAAAKMGDKNPRFGKPGLRRKRVRNTATGVVYESIEVAALAEGVNPKTLYQYLDGTRYNKTPLTRVPDGMLV